MYESRRPSAAWGSAQLQVKALVSSLWVLFIIAANKSVEEMCSLLAYLPPDLQTFGWPANKQKHFTCAKVKAICHHSSQTGSF